MRRSDQSYKVPEFYRVPMERWHDEEPDPPGRVLRQALLFLAGVALGGPIIAVVVQVLDMISL